LITKRKRAKPNDLPLLFDNSDGESEKRKNIGPWAFSRKATMEG
jgi:hypothetical protein